MPWPWILTVVRIVLTIPVVWLTLLRDPVASRIAFVTFAIAALTDTLDGAIARRQGTVTSAGMLWDPIADKILVTASMLALVIVGRFPAWAAAVLIGRELVIGVLRIRMEKRGRGFPASMLGKLKTLLQIIAVLVFILPVGSVASWIETSLVIGAVVTALVSGAIYLWRSVRTW